MLLNELFNNSLPYQITENQKTDFRASFEAPDGSVINVHMFNVTLSGAYAWRLRDHPAEYAEMVEKYGIWDVSFGRNGSKKLTGEGHQLQILSTVMDIIKHFVSIHEPTAITFSAYKGDASRVGVYTRLVTKRANELGMRQYDPTDTTLPLSIRTVAEWSMKSQNSVHVFLIKNQIS